MVASVLGMALPLVARAQGQSVHAPAAFAGCYRIALDRWSPPLTNVAFHLIPTTFRLDTVTAARGGWVVSPDISYPSPHRFRGFPRWAVRGDSVEIVWSDGFQVTRMLIGRRGATELRGRAAAESDRRVAGELFPSTSVVASRIACDAMLP